MNAMPKKKLLTLSDRAAELLPQLAGYHDQGAFVSRLIEEEANRQALAKAIEQEDLPTLREIARELLQERNRIREERWEMFMTQGRQFKIEPIPAGEGKLPYNGVLITADGEALLG